VLRLLVSPFLCGEKLVISRASGFAVAGKWQTRFMGKQQLNIGFLAAGQRLGLTIFCFSFP
jgi:hypothetical protein